MKDKILSSLEPEEPKRDVALVLSSGGARGLAHIGAIDILQERGYHIHSVAGTSMGAVIGAMYASGHLDDFKEWMSTIDRKKVLSLVDIKLSLDSISKGERIINAMKKIVPDCNIEDMQMPFCCIATDAQSGKEVVFKQGSMYDAIRASISIPTFFSPVRRDDALLLDGGLVNPLPLNRVSRTENDLLVAVNVSGRDYQRQSIFAKSVRKKEIDSSKALTILQKLNIIKPDDDFNYYSLINRVISIMINNNAQMSIKLTPPDILVNIPMYRYATFDFDKYERLAEIGRQKTTKAIDAFETKQDKQKNKLQLAMQALGR